MKKYLTKGRILPLLLVLVFATCKKDVDDISCSTNDPTHELPWLKDIIDGFEDETSDLGKYFFVVQGTFNGQTVFVLDNCCPICNTVVVVLDCQGERIGELGDEIPDRASIKNSRIIFKRQDSPCQ